MLPSHKQLIGGLIFLALSIFYGLEAGRIFFFFTKEGQVFTARTVPYTLSLLGIVFSSALIIPPLVRLVRQRRLSRGSSHGDREAVRPGAYKPNWLPVLLLIILMAAYAALFSLLGFIAATTGFLIGAFAVLGARGWRSVLLIPVCITAAFRLLIGGLLSIHLAEGTIWNFLR